LKFIAENVLEACDRFAEWRLTNTRLAGFHKVESCAKICINVMIIFYLDMITLNPSVHTSGSKVAMMIESYGST
jgi:hypothetical protein